MPSKDKSYKGYSPPECMCNVISHIQVKTYTFLLKCLHAMDENVTHNVPCPESSSTPSHIHMPSMKTVIYVPLMTFFFKTKAFYFINQNPLDNLRYQRLTVGFACLPTLSRTFITGYICLSKNIVIPNTHIFHFFFLLCDRETHFGRCPISPIPPIEHQTQCRSLPCTHTHVMRYTVHKCNAMPLHVSHVTCTMNATSNNTNHTLCQVSWIIIFNTYNLHPFNSIFLSHVFQHASIQSPCDSFFMHYKHTSH